MVVTQHEAARSPPQTSFAMFLRGSRTPGKHSTWALAFAFALYMAASAAGLVSQVWEWTRWGASGSIAALAWPLEVVHGNTTAQALIASMCGGLLMGWMNRCLSLVADGVARVCGPMVHRRMEIPPGASGNMVLCLREYLGKFNKVAPEVVFEQAVQEGKAWKVVAGTTVLRSSVVVWCDWCMVAIAETAESQGGTNPVMRSTFWVDAWGLFPRRGLDTFVARVVEDAGKRAVTEKSVTVYEPEKYMRRWSKRQIESRPLSTTFYEGGVGAQLIQDVATFWKNQAWFEVSGMAQRCGVLAYGPPGTGKTTLAVTLATELNMPIAYLTIDKTTGSDELMGLLRSCPDMCILLVEDVDTMFGGDNSSISLSTFLNCLDGLSAPRRATTYMTTNHPERLPPALVRCGRFDFKVLLPAVSADPIRQYLSRVFAGVGDDTLTAIAEVFGSPPTVMATVQCFAHMHSTKLHATTAPAQGKELARTFLEEMAVFTKASTVPIPPVGTIPAAATHAAVPEGFFVPVVSAVSDVPATVVSAVPTLDLADLTVTS